MNVNKLVTKQPHSHADVLKIWGRYGQVTKDLQGEHWMVIKLMRMSMLHHSRHMMGCVRVNTHSRKQVPRYWTRPRSRQHVITLMRSGQRHSTDGMRHTWNKWTPVYWLPEGMGLGKFIAGVMTGVEWTGCICIPACGPAGGTAEGILLICGLIVEWGEHKCSEGWEMCLSDSGSRVKK